VPPWVLAHEEPTEAVLSLWYEREAFLLKRDL
jgi:hypothetical protein